MEVTASKQDAAKIGENINRVKSSYKGGAEIKSSAALTAEARLDRVQRARKRKGRKQKTSRWELQRILRWRKNQQK